MLSLITVIPRQQALPTGLACRRESLTRWRFVPDGNESWLGLQQSLQIHRRLARKATGLLTFSAQSVFLLRCANV
jgi:hypothetical protein